MGKWGKEVPLQHLKHSQSEPHSLPHFSPLPLPPSHFPPPPLTLEDLLAQKTHHL